MKTIFLIGALLFGCAGRVEPVEVESTAEPLKLRDIEEFVGKDWPWPISIPFRATQERPAILARSNQERERYTLVVFPDRQHMAEWRIKHREDYQILMLLGV